MPNNNCAPNKLVEETAAFGRTSRIPMLWIYAENDTYFGPELTKRMHEAFIAAGGKAEYHMLPPFESDAVSVPRSVADGERTFVAAREPRTAV